MTPVISSFSGPYSWLSNFHIYPIVVDGQEWKTVEHYFQAAKTLDIHRREEIRNLATPREAKALGRASEKRPDWDLARIPFMWAALESKFGEKSPLRRKLVDTGDTKLIEGNTWHDNDWGICSCPKCQREVRDARNLLGRLLMTLRDEISHHEQAYRLGIGF